MALHEPWLRGPVADIPPSLQPVAHALIASGEEVLAATRGLPPEQVRRRVGETASIGFHLAHLAGSTDGLMTYARGANRRAMISAECWRRRRSWM